ncbi:MAG: NDP-sugar synthase [Bdellovibrionaceae bacterium]|nr:NDP-sugar synthase [Pseudobdellovibrionaceae bacterium]
MKLMLLAAGLGTRLRPVTDRYAKPAVPFMNIPLLYYPFTLLEPAGLSCLVVNTHYKPEQIERLVHSIPGYRGQVQITHEDGQPLGSGGGVWNARAHLERETDFFVANGDEVIFPSRASIAGDLMHAHRASGALATIYVTRHADVGTRFGGVWTRADGAVLGFGKQRPQGVPSDTIGFHYVGVLALSGRIFRFLPEGESNLLYDALMAGIKAGERVRVFEDTCTWFETGNVPDFLSATRQMMQSLGTAQESPFFRVLRERFRPQDGLHLTPQARVWSPVPPDTSTHSEFRGFAVLGDHCQIGSRCRIENSILLPMSQLADGAAIQNQILV